MTIPAFKRTHVQFTGGDDIHGKYVEAQPVKVLNAVADQGEEDEEADLWRVKLANGDIRTVEGYDMHPHPEAPTTNVEAITHLMEHGQTAFTQAFILEAAIRYADQLLADEAASLKQMEGAFISGELVISTAHEVRDYLNAHLKG
jgi:hypothetical protein